MADPGVSNISTIEINRLLFQQPDRAVERRWAQVHVALRHRQVHVPGEFLDRPCRRSTHCQVGAEPVTEDVQAPIGKDLRLIVTDPIPGCGLMPSPLRHVEFYTHAVKELRTPSESR